MGTITLGFNTYNLVTLPPSPGISDIVITMMDSIAVVGSPFVPSQAQTQQWPGADGWGAQVTPPKIWLPKDKGMWRAFLAGCQGMLNVFQVGDPDHPKPLGVAMGAPQVDGTVSGGNAVTSNLLHTKGWTANVFRQLLPGDYLQIGYRLYMATAQVDADGSGKAAIAVWPSLRETPADGAAIQLVSCQGVFRLSANKRQWHMSPDKLMQVGIGCSEVR